MEAESTGWVAHTGPVKTSHSNRPMLPQVRPEHTEHRPHTYWTILLDCTESQCLFPHNKHMGKCFFKSFLITFKLFKMFLKDFWDTCFFFNSIRTLVLIHSNWICAIGPTKLSVVIPKHRARSSPWVRQSVAQTGPKESTGKSQQALQNKSFLNSAVKNRLIWQHN